MICIADTEPEIEWIVEPMPTADLHLIKGELMLTQLCTLYQQAACVISSVGFFLPMSIACRTPAFIVVGGRGGHHSPNIVTCPEMPLENIGWAVPDNYCLCTAANHNCNKTIANFEKKFYGWLYETVFRKIESRACLAS